METRQARLPARRPYPATTVLTAALYCVDGVVFDLCSWQCNTSPPEKQTCAQLCSREKTRAYSSFSVLNPTVPETRSLALTRRAFEDVSALLSSTQKRGRMFFFETRNHTNAFDVHEAESGGGVFACLFLRLLLLSFCPSFYKAYTLVLTTDCLMDTEVCLLTTKTTLKLFSSSNHA